MPTTTTCRACRAGMRDADTFCWTCGSPREGGAADRLEVVTTAAVRPRPPSATRRARAPKTPKAAGAVKRSPHPAHVQTRVPRPVTGGRPTRGQAGRIIAVFAVLLVAAVATAVWWLLRPDDTATTAEAAPAPTASAPPGATRPEPLPVVAPTPAETTPAPAYPTGVLTASRVTAPSTSPDSADAGGRTTSYQAANVLDGDASTAWRTEGDASGSSLSFSFDRPVRITRVGLVNGFAKVDAYDGTDRYAQGRRVLAVTWTFDTPTGPVSVPQPLADGPRGLQLLPVAPVEASSVRLTIDAVTSPGAGGRFDRTAISDVQFANL